MKHTIFLLTIFITACGSNQKKPQDKSAPNLPSAPSSIPSVEPISTQSVPSSAPSAEPIKTEKDYSHVRDQTKNPSLKDVPSSFAKDGFVWEQKLLGDPLIPGPGKPKNNQVIATISKNIAGSKKSISIVHGNLLTENVEAVVNAANERLTGGGGIDGAIHRAAGPKLKEEAIAYKELHNLASFPTGSAMVMNPHDLKQFKLIIVTVGPSGSSNAQTDKELYSAMYNSLLKAQEYGIKSVATVAISTGIFGFPLDIATELYFKAALQFFHDFPHTSIETIRITNYDEVGQGKNTVSEIYQGFKKIFQ